LDLVYIATLPSQEKEWEKREWEQECRQGGKEEERERELMECTHGVFEYSTAASTSISEVRNFMLYYKTALCRRGI